MNKQFKRTVLMILGAVMLFAGSMVIPVGYNPEIKGFLQGAALGFMIAAFISIILLLLGIIKDNKA